ncbi:MAG: integrase [Rickettsiales bacterium]|jgi:integrase
MPNLNDKFIRSLPTPQTKHKIYWDDRLTGFGLRITNNNAKSFILRYVINGRERKYTIGSYPDFSYTSAKEQATQIKGEITKGFDPLEKKKQNHDTPTIKEFAADFLKAKAKVLRPSTLESYRVFFLEKHIIPKFGNLKINSISKKEIEMFHSSFAQTPRMGNRVLEMMRSMFNIAVSWGILEKNPGADIKKFLEYKRERYLSDDEITRLIRVLDEEPSQINSHIIKLILLTGSRKGEVLSARWQDFDFKNEVWMKPAELTKQKRSSHIPLSKEVMEILHKMKKNITSEKKDGNRKEDYIISNDYFLFYNLKTKSHLKDIKRFWITVCKKAQITNATIHDLRHTYASVLVNSGIGLEVIGKLIGHSNVRTTQRYAHLVNSTLKQATEVFGSKIGAIK